MRAPRFGAALLATAMLVPAAATAAEDAAKGRAVFRGHCMQCHGEKADGHGPLAARFNPPPADIASSTKTGDYMLQIVTLGGAALGRSEAMPEWGLELTGAEILDVVAYLEQVRAEARAARTKAAGGTRPGGKS